MLHSVWRYFLIECFITNAFIITWNASCWDLSFVFSFVLATVDVNMSVQLSFWQIHFISLKDSYLSNCKGVSILSFILYRLPTQNVTDRFAKSYRLRYQVPDRETQLRRAHTHTNPQTKILLCYAVLFQLTTQMMENKVDQQQEFYLCIIFFCFFSVLLLNTNNNLLCFLKVYRMI